MQIVASIILPGINDIGKAGDELFHDNGPSLNPTLGIQPPAAPQPPSSPPPTPYAIPLRATTPHRAVRRRYRGRLRARGRCPALLGRDAHAFGSIFADAASGEDPPDRVWSPCGGQTRPARARQTGDLQLPGFHLHLRQIPPGQIPPQSEDPTRSHAGETRGDQGRDASAAAPANPRPRGVAEAG